MSFERVAPEQHDTLDGVGEPSETRHLRGHRDVVSRLASAYRDGKLPHALLFSGPPGIGKATLAYHLAHHLLANPDPASAPGEFLRPDTASGLWRQVATGAHPSVLHLTRSWDEKNKRFKTVLSVDEIRRVGRFLSLTGMGPQDLRAALGQPEMLAAVVAHLRSDESLLLVFSAEAGVAPEQLIAAERLLGGDPSG